MLHELDGLPDHVRSVDLRHRGTDHCLEIVAATPQAALAAFTAAHRTRYGFDRDAEVEVVNARVLGRAPTPSPPRGDTDPWDMPDRPVKGPTLVRSSTTSVLVPAGWTARRTAGLLRLDLEADVAALDSTARTPLGVALWGGRFMFVAEQAGEVLRRLARSVNIRERRDFSCALFDGEGHLVANAPHIPVHLGAMGATVRDLIASEQKLSEGQAWLCNAPDAGGSHLPDLTVVSPVDSGSCRWFVACRGHHADVGGITPGSMPARSTSLSEEGFALRHLPLLWDGRLRTDLKRHLAGCRELPTVLADLEAQLAANAHAADALRALGRPELVDSWMGHIQDVAAEAALGVIARLPDQCVATDVLAGIPLRLALSRTTDGLRVDLHGTGGPSTGNLNAPHAVVRAAVLYGLRVLGKDDIPLNEGTLRHVEFQYPDPSLVAPPPTAAVAGGNVETSQRLVDLVLRATGHMAASAGTMSNLTLGGDGWSLYETVGAGQGASASGPGPSGRQLHMTNTRATDAEELEVRLPVRLRQFSLRPRSGGPGQHAGGDGLIREIEVLTECSASLLATRRMLGAPGMHGGEAGQPGEDQLRIGGRWTAWSGDATRLSTGDRVRVSTPGGGGWGHSTESGGNGLPGNSR